MRLATSFRVALRAALLTSALVIPGLALAHHSFAVFFDSQKMVEVTGVVTAFQFVNPHGVIRLQVKNAKGEIEDWKFETNSPSILRRRGWTPQSLKIGETVTIEGWAAKESPHYGRLRTAKRENGEPIGKPLGMED